MDGLGFIFIIIAVIVSILGEAGKHKRKGPPPPGRVPQPRPQPQRPRLPPQRPTLPPQPKDRAADMVPEDFWRELTGQPRREPEPVPSPDLPSWDEEAIATVEADSRERQTRDEARSLEDYRRPETVRRAPTIINLEASIPTVEQRHTAFHQKVDALKATSAPAVVTEEPRNPWLARLRAHGAAQEGVVMAEIFGPPKGLEDDPLRG